MVKTINWTKRVAVVAAAAIVLAIALFQPAYAVTPLASGSVSTSLASGGVDAGAGNLAQGVLETQAAQTWKTITTPDQLRNLHFSEKGFGPGYYKIGNDFTLGDDCYTESQIATCALLRGTYVIDFNGHTVQSSGQTLAAFTVQGANVTFLDSKASSSKVSINGLGAACIEVREGSVTIMNGNYACKQFDPGGSAVYVGNGTCTINGGAYVGTVNGVCNAGGKLTINGGEFYGGYPFALLHMDGTTRIVRGAFQGASDAYGFACALGMLSLGNARNFNTLLAPGSSWSQAPTTIYFSTGASRWDYYPTYSVGYGIVTPFSYAGTNAQQVAVTGKVGAQKSDAVTAPTLKSLTAGKGRFDASWSKVAGATKYQLRYSTKKSMGGAKIVNVAKKSNARTVKGLASKKTYYVQVRAFQKIGGTTYFSPWSGKKSVKVE